VLRTERIVHIALQRDIRFNRETGKRSRVHHLAPDVFARWNGIEDAIPTAVEIKDRHVQNQDRVMPGPARAKPFSRFLLIRSCHLHRPLFNAPGRKLRGRLTRLRWLGWRVRTTTPNPHCRRRET